MTEQVSEGVFEAFKQEMLRGFNELNNRISELTGEIRVYSQNAQCQGQELAVQKKEIEILNELKKEVKEQGDKIIVLDTESKGRQRTTVLVFSVITIVIGTISVCVAIFK